MKTAWFFFLKLSFSLKKINNSINSNIDKNAKRIGYSVLITVLFYSSKLQKFYNSSKAHGNSRIYSFSDILGIFWLVYSFTLEIESI